MEIIDDMWNNDRMYVRHKLSNGQTLHLEMSVYNKNEETIQWNIAVGVYSKRKHASQNEDLKRITGKNPFETVAVGLKAFKMLESAVRTQYANRNHIIFCTWVDNRRRDAYYKILHRWGYDWGVIDSFKCIMKYFPKMEETI